MNHGWGLWWSKRCGGNGRRTREEQRDDSGKNWMRKRRTESKPSATFSQANTDRILRSLFQPELCGSKGRKRDRVAGSRSASFATMVLFFERVFSLPLTVLYSNYFIYSLSPSFCSVLEQSIYSIPSSQNRTMSELCSWRRSPSHIVSRFAHSLIPFFSSFSVFLFPFLVTLFWIPTPIPALTLTHSPRYSSTHGSARNLVSFTFDRSSKGEVCNCSQSIGSSRSLFPSLFPLYYYFRSPHDSRLPLF